MKNNPFYNICDRSGTEVEGSLFGSAHGGVNEPKLPPMPTVEVKVPTTLQEFYTGCVKTISYQKQTVGLDGKTTSQTVCNKQVEIKAGMDPNNNQKFRGEGHQQPGRPASNLYVNFLAAPPNPKSADFHVTSRYRRSGANLMYRQRITLQDAILCKPVKIPLLDGRTILLAIDEVITPKTVKKIAGEGMRIYNKKDHMNEGTEKGDLLVSFEILFPHNLTTE